MSLRGALTAATSGRRLMHGYVLVAGAGVLGALVSSLLTVSAWTALNDDKVLVVAGGWFALVVPALASLFFAGVIVASPWIWASSDRRATLGVLAAFSFVLSVLSGSLAGIVMYGPATLLMTALAWWPAKRTT